MNAPACLPWSSRPRSPGGVPATAVALALLVVAGPVAAQVFKCVDRSGHVTYQESPCAAGQGGPVALPEPLLTQPGSPSSEKQDAAWRAAAREGRAIVGMPKPFVTQALGSPAEIRAPRNGESGTEVWVYPRNGQVTRIGFSDGAVGWMRSDLPPERPGSGPAAGPRVDREARVREGLQVGKACTLALQDAGPPDKEEPLRASTGAIAGTRYLYVFDAGNANAYAAFVCIEGRVTSVERYIPGR